MSQYKAPVFELEDWYEQEDTYDRVSECPDSLQPYYEGEWQ